MNCKRKEEIRKKKRKAMLHYGIKELKQVTSCESKERERSLRQIPNLFINNSTCVKLLLLFCLETEYAQCMLYKPSSCLYMSLFNADKKKVNTSGNRSA